MKIKTPAGSIENGGIFIYFSQQQHGGYMEQNTNSIQTPAASSSLITRATNVFASPSELYSEVAAQPVKASSWSIPLVISLVLAVIFTFSLYNNPSLRQQIYDSQERNWKQAVAQGKMTQDQYEQFSNGMESSGPTMFMLIGGGAAVLTISVFFFGLALVVWLIVKFGLKASASYGKMLEVLGLGSFISIVATLVTLLLMNAFNTMYATPGGSLLIMSSFDPTSVLHRFIASINIFTIWEVVVLGIGISKISGKTTGVGIGIMGGLWIVWVILSSWLGLGMR